MKACMGGNCTRRDQCPHYTEAFRGFSDAERLCIRGRDGIRLIEAAAFRVLLIDVFTGKQIEKVEEEEA